MTIHNAQFENQWSIKLKMKVQGMIHPNLYFCIQSLAVIAHILKSILGHVEVKQEKFN